MNNPTGAAELPEALKDHQIAALVNELRDIAVEFHGTQQLRERIAYAVVPLAKATQALSAAQAGVPAQPGQEGESGAHQIAVAMLNEMHERMGAELVRKCNFDSLAFERIAQRHIEAAIGLRHAPQAEGKHPAPCARFCEAQAFGIEIRNLKSQLAARAAPQPATADAVRLDHLQKTGSTIDLLPGETEFHPMRFRVGGLHKAVSTDVREAIDAALATHQGDHK